MKNRISFNSTVYMVPSSTMVNPLDSPGTHSRPIGARKQVSKDVRAQKHFAENREFHHGMVARKQGKFLLRAPAALVFCVLVHQLRFILEHEDLSGEGNKAILQQVLVRRSPRNVARRLGNMTNAEKNSKTTSDAPAVTSAPPRGSWCDALAGARADLNPSMSIRYPCQDMKPATSAVVCMLTGAVDATRANKILFTAREYIEGAMALGTTLMENIDPKRTHQLLLLKEGFELSHEDMIRLESAGWTIGTAPDFDLLPEYVPEYERYKTTYTKVTAIGLGEYQCVLLMDPDTLAVGDMKQLMTCSKFTRPHQTVAGTLDLDRGKWFGMNTGCLLYRPDAREMNRVFQLSRNNTFMKRYGSDQDFLNHVYPERLNVTRNNEIIARGNDSDTSGVVVDLTWDYNAQTHVEVERIHFWEVHRPQVKILHFTRKKGWQCGERYDPPPPLNKIPKTCHKEKGGLRGGKEAQICYCREAHLYWNALGRARALAEPRLSALQTVLIPTNFT